jgi:hypothetical protein
MVYTIRKEVNERGDTERRKMRKERVLNYIKEYDKQNCRQLCLKLNKRTDADILAVLDQLENKQGYIKALIRADIERRRT